MSPRDFAELIADLYPTDVVIHGVGEPGCGKTASCKLGSTILSSRHKTPFGLIGLRLAHHDPVDLTGTPSIDPKTKLTVYSAPKFLPHAHIHGEHGIIVLDEFAQAMPAMQGVARQLLEPDARLGEYVKPAGWKVVLLSNRAGDRAASHRVLSTVASCTLTVPIESDLAQWLAWSVGAGIADVIRSYMGFRPSEFSRFVPGEDGTFPCARTWEMVSKIIPHVRAEHRQIAFAGIVGSSAAGQFITYCDIHSQLPPKKTFLDNPQTCTLPTESSVCFALAGMLAAEAKGATLPTLEAIATIANRMPLETAAYLMRDATAANPAIIQRTAAGKKFVRDHADILLQK
jgi:hypothetical protein